MNKLILLLIGIILSNLSTLTYSETLSGIYSQAKRNDTKLLRLEIQRNAAFEAITSSRSDLLPEVNLTTDYNLSRSNQDRRDSDRLTASINFSQKLYNRSSWITLNQAEKIAIQSDLYYKAAKQSLIIRVTKMYFDVLRAQENLEFIRLENAAVTQQLKQTKHRFATGVATITDVYNAQAEYDRVIANEILSANRLANQYEELREITNQENSNLNTLDTKLFSTNKITASVDLLIDEALQKNSALLATQVAQEIAKNNISLANSRHLPSLTLNSRYSQRSENNINFPHRNYNDFNIGLYLTVPLYSGGNITSKTKQAELAYIIAGQELEAIYRNVTKSVRLLTNNINASINALYAHKQIVISANSSLEATKSGFEVGTRTILDVLHSRHHLYSAKKNLSNARYDYILSVLKLRQVLGTLGEQDILDINSILKLAK
ncbi:outer membrane protein [Candidatus Photodesmus blepharus]|uniref:Outer membrane protein n=1 Tax=Candidatus Photodesmus blepharonis TaxID=1179155 RepID=A0A084CMM4_9GAMM|nr:TolC family outer membrane protein [Candidatus Photodesmus blepharus]KEY91053.1 outer membrane protein [Candidatus Photodesmus blepharus]